MATILIHLNVEVPDEKIPEEARWSQSAVLQAAIDQVGELPIRWRDQVVFVEVID